MTIEAGKASATLPDGITVYYINLFDNRDCVTSTEHVEIARNEIHALAPRASHDPWRAR